MGQANGATDASERKPVTSLRGRSGLVLFIMTMLLGWRLWEYFRTSALVLAWPYGLDYGEGIVWQQANMMLGPDAYGPIDGFPTIVFHYTPVFHFLTLGLSGATGADMLFSGRLVSILSTLCSAVMIAVLAARAMPEGAPRAAKALAACGGALTIFCMWPVTYWSMLMRVDMPGFLFSLIGFWLGLKAYERPRLIYLAAVAFVLAVFTKQTLIVAPAATFLLMLKLRPPLALKGIATCIVLGSATLAAANWLTDGGFVRHIFLYNINRFDPKGLAMMLAVVKAHIVLVAAAGVLIYQRTAGLRARYAKGQAQRISDSKSDLTFVATLLYFGLATLMLATGGKSGSDVNYTIEWLFVLAILAGMALFDAVSLALKKSETDDQSWRRSLAAVGVPAAILAQAWSLSSMDFARMARPSRGAEFAALTERLRASEKPAISDEMVLLIRSGKRVVWEPSIFAELASTGVWNEKPFVDMIRAKDFSMFITFGKNGKTLSSKRYNPAVVDALNQAYPRKEKVGGYTVHLPAL